MTGDGGEAARITVVFPLYRTADSVARLVEAVAGQRPPAGADPARWAEVLFIDDASPDDTVMRLREALERVPVGIPVRVVRNDPNRGLSGSLNRALGMVGTDYVLTCHGDCRFGSHDYVARALQLLDANPDVGAVSGQPMADLDAGLTRAEKVYMASNLMDVFPEPGEAELEPVGFAEGRCDAFRMDALRTAGFYDTGVRTAGEDQVLAARMRAAGYRVCRAPALRYLLSVSTAQDSPLRLAKHAELFGRVHPYLLLANRGTLAGAAGAAAGRNRTRRSIFRLLQLLGGVSWAWAALSLLRRRPPRAAVAALAATTAAKGVLYAPYIRRLDFDPGDVATLAAIQPALDVSYAAGFARGVALLAARRDAPI